MSEPEKQSRFPLGKDPLPRFNRAEFKFCHHIRNDVRRSKERQTTNDFPVRRVSTFRWTREFGARRTKSVKKQYKQLKASGSRFMLLSKRTAFSPSVSREEESDKTRRDEHPLSAQRKLNARQVNSHLSSVFLSPHIDPTAFDDDTKKVSFLVRLLSSSKFLNTVLLAGRNFWHLLKID